MYIYTDVVWIGQPDINEQLVSRETPGSTILVQAYWACDTSRGRHTERATHHGVGVRAYDTSHSQGRRTSVQHITGAAYDRAKHHGIGVQETSSGREQRRERDVSMENVVRDNYVKGLWISCDLNELAASRAHEIKGTWNPAVKPLLAFLKPFNKMYSLCMC